MSRSDEERKNTCKFVTFSSHFVSHGSLKSALERVGTKRWRRITKEERGFVKKKHFSSKKVSLLDINWWANRVIFLLLSLPRWKRSEPSPFDRPFASECFVIRTKSCLFSNLSSPMVVSTVILLVLLLGWIKWGNRFREQKRAKRKEHFHAEHVSHDDIWFLSKKTKSVRVSVLCQQLLHLPRHDPTTAGFGFCQKLEQFAQKERKKELEEVEGKLWCMKIDRITCQLTL